MISVGEKFQSTKFMVSHIHYLYLVPNDRKYLCGTILIVYHFIALKLFLSTLRKF